MGQSDGRTVPLYPPIKEAFIELTWSDLGQSSKRFSTVQELAAFLKAHPLLAQAVGYVPQKERQQFGATFKLPENFFTLKPTDQNTWLTSAKDLIERHGGTVHFAGRAFTSYSLLEKYLDQMKNQR